MIGYEGRRLRQTEARSDKLDCSGEPVELGQDSAEAFEQNDSGRSAEDLLLAGAVMGNMSVTSVTSGEPGGTNRIRDRFNVSEYTVDTTPGTPCVDPAMKGRVF